MPKSESVLDLERLLGEVFAPLQMEFTALQMNQFARHFSLLLKWNKKINLTSLKEPEEIAWRHFGESLFLTKVVPPPQSDASILVDVGSGGGFPGLPLKIAWPMVHAVLLEPNQKKAAFLKEVIRSCGLENTEVRAERLENASSSDLEGRASLVVVRAVGLRGDMLDRLRQLLAPDGRVALFLGTEDSSRVQAYRNLKWRTPVAIPRSHHRVILVGLKV